MKRRPYILWVELEHFYVEASRAVVVLVRDRFVLDAGESARKRGVMPGISARKARALLQGGVFKTWE